jgi:hypothetical protein
MEQVSQAIVFSVFIVSPNVLTVFLFKAYEQASKKTLQGPLKAALNKSGSIKRA